MNGLPVTEILESPHQRPAYAGDERHFALMERRSARPRHPQGDRAVVVPAAPCVFPGGEAKRRLSQHAGTFYRRRFSQPCGRRTAKRQEWRTSVLIGNRRDCTGVRRYDSTGQQYIYNWATAKTQASYYLRIGVALDDGQTYYVSIGLK